MTGMTRISWAAFVLTFLVSMQTEAGCRAAVTATGTASSKPCSSMGRTLAEEQARKQWVTQVTNTFGAPFAAWATARDASLSCPMTGNNLACTFTCTVTAVPCTPTPPEKGDLLHLFAVTSKALPPKFSPYGHLWHTIRFDAASTWQDFRDVERVAGARGDFVDVDSATVGTNVHLFAVGSNGKLWHSIRGTSWQDFRDVGAAVGSPGMVVRRVAAAPVEGDVHVVVIDDAGKLWHTIRFKNDTWQNFLGEVLRGTGPLPPYDTDPWMVDVGAAGFRNELHLALVNRSGNLYHTIRRPGGWQFLGDVRTTGSGPSEKFVRVSAGDANGAIHLCMATESGWLFHTARHASKWQAKWTNVLYETKSGAGLRFTDVSCRQSRADLHLAAVTSDGGLWHTIRPLVNEQWERLGNVEQSEAGERGIVAAVSVVGTRVP